MLLIVPPISVAFPFGMPGGFGNRLLGSTVISALWGALIELSAPVGGLIGAMEDDTWAHASPLNRVITASRIEIHLFKKGITKHELDAHVLSRVSFTLGEKLYFEGNADGG